MESIADDAAGSVRDDRAMGERIYSYDPVIGKGCRALVLGTMPSVKSLEEGFYYAHPRNAFWPMMADILGEPRPRTVGEKKAMLLRHGIALWDTVRSCAREGSLDAAMRQVELNDIGALLAAYPGIRLILLNGGEAWRLFHRIDPAAYAGREALRMPSTSPAYTLSYERKRSVWRDALAGFISREE